MEYGPNAATLAADFGAAPGNPVYLHCYIARADGSALAANAINYGISMTFYATAFDKANTVIP